MLRLSTRDFGDETPFSIEENDRANWEQLPFVQEAGCAHFEGFNGENVLSIHYMPMQDGTISVVVLHSVCDNPIKVAQGLAPRRTADEEYYEPMQRLVNELLAQVCDYPEELD